MQGVVSNGKPSSRVKSALCWSVMMMTILGLFGLSGIGIRFCCISLDMSMES
jgi:hypothetical protein